MRSIRRAEGIVGSVAVLALMATCVGSVVALPDAPSRPRYAGQGNERPVGGGRLVVGVSSNLRTLDPHIAYDSLSIMAVRLVYEGLLDYDHDGALVPGLAERLPEVSGDGLEFVFTLRSGVRFVDGSPLVADDVRLSLERLLSADLGSPAVPFFLSIVGAADFNAGRATSIRGIEVRDARTIAFRLSEPDQTFLNAMAMTFAYPIRLASLPPGAKLSQHPVGTGPFVLESWERGVELRFRRNPRHHDTTPRVERIVVSENLDGMLATARFRNGDLDLLQSPPAVERRRFRAQPDWRPFLAEQAEVAVTGLTLNCEMPPLDDVHVRRAISLAIDRPTRVRLSNGGIVAASQALPPALAGYDEALPSAQRSDLDAARRELAKSRYPNGLPEPIRVITRDDAGGRLSIELLQQDLGRIGIRVEAQPMSFAQYLEETGKRRRAQAFFSAWSMDFPDPSNFLDILFHSRSIHEENSENRSFYRNAVLDQLLDRARAERDRATRIALYEEANEIVARDVPWAFVGYPQTMQVWQPYVRGYAPHPIWSLDVRNVWIDGPRRPYGRRAAAVASGSAR